MKKNLLKILILLIVLLLGLTLQACFDNNGGTDLPDDKTGTDTGDFFSIESVNFNSGYIPQDNLTKGYLIYDEIDFNSVTLDNKKLKTSSVIFQVFYNGENIQTIQPDFNNKYTTFRLDNKGKYTVKVMGESGKGQKLEGSFDFGVVSGGRADRVEVVIKDSEGNTVNEVKGGGSFTFIAQAYSDNTAVEVKNEDFYWDMPSNSGKKDKTFSIGNVTRRETRSHDFYCFIRNNNNQRINISKATFDIVDNLLKTEEFPDGVYYNYHTEKIGNTLSLPVNAAFDGGNYFSDKITAEYRFDNGEIKTIEKSTSASEGKFGLFISYDEVNYSLYDKNDYDYSVDNLGRKKSEYYANGVKYQFDPTKTAVKVYLAVWEKIKTESGFNLVPYVFDSTKLDINLFSASPSDLRITALSGKSKEDSAPFSLTYKDFNKAVIDDYVEVNILCDMDNDGILRDEFEGKKLSSTYQYFVPQIMLIGGSLSDYFIEFSYESMNSPIELVVNQSLISGDLERYYVSPNEGFVKMKVKSVFGSLEHEITIKVVNKIFENAKRITPVNANSIGVFYDLDLRPFVKVKEYRLSDYDDKSYNFRSLREDEVLEYYLDGELTPPEGLVFENNGVSGQDIAIKIAGVNYTVTVNGVYIIQDFCFSLLGEDYGLSQANGSAIYGGNVTAYSGTKEIYFYGLIPQFDIELGEEDTVNDDSLTLDADGDFYTSYYNGVFTVKYKFSYFESGKTYDFFAEVLRIIVK